MEKYGLQATTDAYGAKQSTLYLWWKTYKDNGYKITSLNPCSQARAKNNKREVHPLIIKEIKRLRLKVCPNMGKAKIKRIWIYSVKRISYPYIRNQNRENN